MHRPILLMMLVGAVALGACSSSSTPTPAAASNPPASSAPAASASASAGAASAAADAVTIQNFAFNPATISIKVGGTVTWTNMDSAGHTVTFDSGSNTSDTLATGATYSQTFTTAGTFTYHCKIHPSMKGTVEVTG